MTHNTTVRLQIHEWIMYNENSAQLCILLKLTMVSNEPSCFISMVTSSFHLGKSVFFLTEEVNTFLPFSDTMQNGSLKPRNTIQTKSLKPVNAILNGTKTTVDIPENGIQSMSLKPVDLIKNGSLKSVNSAQNSFEHTTELVIETCEHSAEWV